MSPCKPFSTSTFEGEDLSVHDDGSGITARCTTEGKKSEIRISPESISAENIDSFNASDHHQKRSSIDITDLDVVELQSSDLTVLDTRRVEANEVIL